MNDTNSLARQAEPWSLAAIGQRISLYQQPGWGLEGASAAQLNLLSLYCQKLHLLPGEEVTLYGGKPWITVDGRVTLMRRDHKDEYRGHALRPLDADEKALWGYEAGDIVVECTVRTKTTGEIKAYGRVRINELDGTPEINAGTGKPAERLNPLARRGRFPVEMAMKRALQRGERFAFGTAHDDEDPEDVARMLVAERSAPERIQLNAATYDRVFADQFGDEGSEDEDAAAAAVFEAPESSAGAQSAPAAGSSAEVPDTARQTLLLRQNARLLLDARQLNLKGLGALTCNETWPLDKVIAANAELQRKIGERNGDARTAAAQDQAFGTE